MTVLQQPLVSIIIPAYNAEAYTDDALRSALAQNVLREPIYPPRSSWGKVVSIALSSGGARNTIVSLIQRCRTQGQRKPLR